MAGVQEEVAPSRKGQLGKSARLEIQVPADNLPKLTLELEPLFVAVIEVLEVVVVCIRMQRVSRHR